MADAITTVVVPAPPLGGTFGVPARPAPGAAADQKQGFVHQRLQELLHKDPLDLLPQDKQSAEGPGWQQPTRFSHGFYRGPEQWLSEALHMVERAVTSDALLPVDPSVTHSSSVVDVTDIVSQVKNISREKYNTKKEIEKLCNDICRCFVYFSQEIMKRTTYDNLNLEMKQVQQMCVSVSNVELARRSLLKLLCELRPDDAVAEATDCGSEAERQEAQEQLADAAERATAYMACLVKNRVDDLGVKVVCGVRRALLDLQKSTDQDSWLRYLDDLLTVLYARLRPRHLNHILDATWDGLKTTVEQTVEEHINASGAWFRRLQNGCHQLVSFLSRADDRSPGAECPSHAVKAAVDEVLMPHTLEAAQLQHLARLRRRQSLLEEAADPERRAQLLGSLGMRASRWDQQGGPVHLTMQIMHAVKLPPHFSKKMYVKIKFSPSDCFKDVEECKTSTCKKDVPLFESIFNRELARVPEDALLVLVLKKASPPAAQQLVGSALKRSRVLAIGYVALSEVARAPDIDSSADINTLAQLPIMYVPLGAPGKADPEIVRILKARDGDKACKSILKNEIFMV